MDQELLARSDHLAAKNQHPEGPDERACEAPDAERATLGEIGHRLGEGAKKLARSAAGRARLATIPASTGSPTVASTTGMVTGLSFFFAEIGAKRVELIKEAIPTLTRVIIFVNRENLANLRALPVMERTASALAVEPTRSAFR